MRALKIEGNEEDVELLEGAAWITHPLASEQILQFEKSFACKGIISAQLLICGLGFFDAFLNEKQIDDAYFKPIFTDYNKRDVAKNSCLLIGKKQTVCVHFYDVTEMLTEGDNLLTVFVGNGYYHNEDRPEEPYVSYGDKKLIFSLKITTKEGTQYVNSDLSVKVKYLPRTSRLYKGEEIDFTAKDEALVDSVFAEPVSGEVRILKTDTERLCDKVDREIKPAAAWWLDDNLIYDFGINHSGGVALKVKGEKGRKLRLRFAEVLYENGELNTETSSWDARDENGEVVHRIEQEGNYVLSGEEDIIYPMFSWNCYRYVEIIDAKNLIIEDVRSLFIHSNVEKSGTFHCEDALLNKLYDASRLSLLNNMHAGVISDCPHREKRPYTGDGQLVSEMMLYDLDAEAFLSKWLWDIVNAQTKDGFIPYSAPYISGGGGYAWSYALVEVADQLYKFTGKEEYISRVYEGVINLLGYFKAHSENEIIVSTCQAWHLGDWLTPEITRFNVQFMSSMVYYNTAYALERFSRILKNGREQEFATIKEKIKDAINERFFNEEELCYCNGIQGENVLPLAYGIVPKKYEAALREKVRLKYLVENNLHIDTGIIATPVLIEYLTENQMEDIAFSIMLQKDYPSYHAMLDGESTLCEHWSKKWPDYYINNTDEIVKGGGHLSHCHVMFASVVAWLYKRVAGIDASKAFRGEIYYTPRFINKLSTASAKVRTRFGIAEISWKSEGRFTAEITVPPNAKGIFDCKMECPLTFQSLGQSQTVYPVDGKITFEMCEGKWTVE